MAVLAGCAAPAVETPSPDARAVVVWTFWAVGDELESDPVVLWNWYVTLALPDDDVECELSLSSAPNLAESGWIGYRPSVQVTRSGGFEERRHSIFSFYDQQAPKLITPRPYYLIDNPGMRFRWIDPSSLPPTEPSPTPPPEPPNAEVPRAVVDRLVALRDTSRGREVTLDLDDVVMKWALPFLRSELAKSAAH
jgi:hypothetical protein